ncbi:MAG TPA: hypothetical protein VJ773_03125 [Gemmatimonadales bacterium]|nr:hypothetical protein [Gemmatimonadales bacterium]
MAARTIRVDGVEWAVAPTGRVTQFTRDEFGLAFTRGSGPEAERRVVRYAPRGSRIPEFALAELSEARLVEFLHRSQPAWTSPDLGYGR